MSNAITPSSTNLVPCRSVDFVVGGYYRYLPKNVVFRVTGISNTKAWTIESANSIYEYVQPTKGYIYEKITETEYEDAKLLWLLTDG